jgi:hypothetical protein
MTQQMRRSASEVQPTSQHSSASLHFPDPIPLQHRFSSRRVLTLAAPPRKKRHFQGGQGLSGDRIVGVRMLTDKGTGQFKGTAFLDLKDDPAFKVCLS